MRGKKVHGEGGRKLKKGGIGARRGRYKRGRTLVIKFFYPSIYGHSLAYIKEK